jgi:transposase
MPESSLIRSLLLPELSLVGAALNPPARTMEVRAEKVAKEEYCPRCATVSVSGYDHRRVRVKDEPLRGVQVRLTVRKRRLWCKPCRKPFTEPIPHICSCVASA